MQVSVEATNSLQRRMTVGIPKERVDNEVRTRLQSLARKSRINGFRPGKVPVKVIEQRYGTQVRQEVIGEVMQESLSEAVTQEKLQVVGQPAIESIDDKGQGEDISYTVEFEVYPEVGDLDTADLSVEKPVCEVAEDDVNEMIDNLRKQRETWNEVERAAQDGDSLLIDYKGLIDGEAFDGGSAEQQQLILGAKRYMPEFEAALVGASAGSSVETEVNFPDDYQSKAVAGKQAHFTLTIHSVSESELPQVDDTFAAALGVDEGADALRQQIRDNLEREMRQAIKTSTKTQVFDALLEKNAIEVPDSMVKEEAQRLMANLSKQFESQGVDVGQFAKLEDFTENATKRVKTGVLTAQLVTQMDLAPNPERVRNLVEEYAASYEDPEELVKWYYADASRLADVNMAVLEEQIVEKLLEDATVTEKTVAFKELVKKN